MAMFRVECVDKATGATVFHTLAAPTANEARDLASRMNYIVGATEICAHSANPAPRRRWVWPFMAGFVAGPIVATVLILTAVPFAMGLLDRPAKSAAASPSRATWNDRWPSLSFPPRNTENVRFEYDKFNNYTSIEARPMPFEIWTTVTGNADRCATPPEWVYITVVRQDRRISDDFTFIADGVRIAPEHDSGSFDRATFRLNTTDLLSIVAAKAIEGRLNYEEFTLTETDISIMRNFASTLHP